MVIRMNLLQDSIRPEHHLVECAFHHHDTGPKKKMLGGVSFDGGMTEAAAREKHRVSQAGALKQPPFSDVQFTDIGSGIGGRGVTGKETAGSHIKGTGRVDGRGKDTVNIVGIQDKKDTDKDMEAAVVQAAAASVEIPAADKAADVVNTGWHKIEHRYRADYQKYIGKLRNGIRAFLRGMEQNAKRQDRQRPKKKTPQQLREVTKEDIYEIQINTAYLLDSYNKYGERSILGKE